MSFTLTELDINGCVNSSTGTISLIPGILKPAAIESIISSGNQIKVYPNPFSENFSIELSEVHRYTIEVRDMLGRSIIKKEYTGSGNYTIDGSILAPSPYILTVTDEKGTTYKYKLVKAENR